jgi:hypoxanthine phosphoribosyltransferase
LKFIAPSWDEILSKSIRLAEKIRASENFQFDCIVGVSRGGLPLTRIMSDLMDIQNVMITRCEYYNDIGEKKKKPIITQKIQGNISDRNVLVVDDVADTGESLIVIKSYLELKRPSQVKIATVYIKPWCKVLPDYYVSKTEKWIIFPWEYYEAIKSLSATNSKDILAKTHIPPKYIDMLYRMDRSLRERWKHAKKE